MSKHEKAMIYIFIVYSLVLFIWTTFIIIRFPYGVDYGEAPLMDQVRRIQSGEILYKTDINTPPYVVSNYPPLYPLFVALTNSISKISLFQSGRLISLSFSLISGAIIGLFGFHLTGNKILGYFAAALFWGHPYVMAWSSLARVDMMALAFSLLGLWILYRHWKSWSWLAIAILCFLASAFTRQTYLLAGPLGGFVWLWYQNRRRSLAFASLFGFSGLMIFALINLITSGGFYNNIVVANINQYDISRTLAMSEQFLAIWPLILLTGLVAAIATAWAQLRKGKTEQDVTGQQPFIFSGLVFYSLGALISTLTVGKVGSDNNYFLELIAASVLWCVIAVKFILEQKKSLRTACLGLLFIQLIWMLAVGYWFNRTTIGERWRQIAFYEGLFQQVQSATKDGIVLSDDYLDMVVLSGQPIYYQPFEYGQLFLGGLWDPSNFALEIESRKFPLILIGGRTLEKPCCWPVKLITAISHQYEINYDPNLVTCKPK